MHFINNELVSCMHEKQANNEILHQHWFQLQNNLPQNFNL